MDVAIVGAGPAGLIAAEHLARAGYDVVVFERMPSPARKLLMAGRGGLNLTHSEPLDELLRRFQPAEPLLLDAIRAFPPQALISWANGLGIETFVGSSGRVFPTSMKASPLLRAWLARLTSLGVRLERDHRLTAVDSAEGLVGPRSLRLTFTNKAGDTVIVTPRAALLALGGASWPRLGSDGGWVQQLAAHGIEITPLASANSGLTVSWSQHLVERFAGTPLKRIRLVVGNTSFSGELILTRTGLEGTPAYAAGPLIRKALSHAAGNPVDVMIDLRPDLSQSELERRLTKPRGKQSLNTFLRKSAGLTPPAIALLHEFDRAHAPSRAPETARTAPIDTSPAMLAARIKALRVSVTGLAGLERAISTAGGISWQALDAHFMLHRLPGVFVAGEMLDWEAPTGGYLLQGCFATGLAAAHGIERCLQRPDQTSAKMAPGSPPHPLH